MSRFQREEVEKLPRDNRIAAMFVPHSPNILVVADGITVNSAEAKAGIMARNLLISRS